MRKKKGLQPTEAETQKAILQFLGYVTGAFFWRNNTGAVKIVRNNGKKGFVKFGLKGSPDIIGCYRGNFVAFEVKSAKGIASPEQKNFLNRIKKCGGYSFIVRSVEDVVESLEKIKIEIEYEKK